MSDAQLQKTYNKLHDLLSPTNRHRTSSEIHDSLKRIRRVVLTEGIPELVSRFICSSSSQADKQEDEEPLRPRIWKLMLKVDKLHGKDFMRYVSLGPSVVSHKSQSTPLYHDCHEGGLI